MKSKYVIFYVIIGLSNLSCKSRIDPLKTENDKSTTIGIDLQSKSYDNDSIIFNEDPSPDGFNTTYLHAPENWFIKNYSLHGFTYQSETYDEENNLRALYIIDSLTEVQKYETYYENGELQETGEQGFFEGCGVSVGETKNYNLAGSLISSETYNYWLPKGGNGCHDMGIIITKEYYHSNGEIKKITKMESGYQSGDCPCGRWTFFDMDGNLIEEAIYQKCDDGIIECDF